MRIGVVDSGIGGITTLHAIMNYVHAEYYYYMDNIHVPYGMRGQEELENIAELVMSAFERVHVDLVVIACNTLSAMVGEYLREHHDVPIVCIEPALREAERDAGATILLATPNTIHSKRIHTLISDRLDTQLVACDSLATLIENGELERAKYEVKTKLAGRIASKVVLGCTHYVYLKEYIESLGYKVYEGNDGVARRCRYLVDILGAKDAEESVVYMHMTRTRETGSIEQYLGTQIEYW